MTFWGKSKKPFYTTETEKTGYLLKYKSRHKMVAQFASCNPNNIFEER